MRSFRLAFLLLPLLGLLSYFFYAFITPSEKKLTIGSKRFTESYILGEILKQLAEQVNEAKIDFRPGMGNTAIVYSALKEGLIDLYPEYTGTIVHEILKRPHTSPLSLQEINAH